MASTKTSTEPSILNVRDGVCIILSYSDFSPVLIKRIQDAHKNDQLTLASLSPGMRINTEKLRRTFESFNFRVFQLEKYTKTDTEVFIKECNVKT